MRTPRRRSPVRSRLFVLLVSAAFLAVGVIMFLSPSHGVDHSRHHRRALENYGLPDGSSAVAIILFGLVGVLTMLFLSDAPKNRTPEVYRGRPEDRVRVTPGGAADTRRRLAQAAQGTSADGLSVTERIPGSPAATWRALTAATDAWWPQMSWEPVVGRPVRESSVEGGLVRATEGVVVDVDEEHLLAFEWSAGDASGVQRVRIELEAEGDATKLTVTETGFAADASGRRLRADREAGWGQRIGVLGRAVARAHRG